MSIFERMKNICADQISFSLLYLSPVLAVSRICFGECANDIHGDHPWRDSFTAELALVERLDIHFRPLEYEF